jgi:hypothetical protein
LRLWFNDGEDPAPDVVEWSAPNETVADLQPLARVFNSYWSNGERYRNHRIHPLEGATEARQLAQDLGEALRAMQPDDDAWLIFNGHGRLQEDLDNTIELWNGTWLTVGDLSALLQLAPQQSRIRFLFTQCYAGAFTRLADSPSERCGFVAEAAEREAEGCSAAIDKAAFEDYSTHFFAALAGATRNGEPLPQAPDRNVDAEISPLEAHYYSLLAAVSSDIPRATSESLLEQWRPWYKPIASWLLGEGQSVYRTMAAELMASQQLDSAAAIAQRRSALQKARAALQREQGVLAEEAALIRDYFEAEILRRWPRAGFVYTRNFKRFLEQDLAAAQQFIVSHPDYPRLKRRQQRYWALDDQLLQNERALTQLEKIEHLLALDQSLRVLQVVGPASLFERYQQLLDCESAPF